MIGCTWIRTDDYSSCGVVTINSTRNVGTEQREEDDYKGSCV